MTGSSRGLALLGAIAGCALGAAPSADAAETRRFALLIANNTGGDGTSPLHFARDDAEKLGGVLGELGGFLESDLHYVFDGDADRARRALTEVEARVRTAKASGAETTLLVYYSGHARDGALRLGQSRWPMSELRGALGRSAADVRIGIIDACQSGAITRDKGGRAGPSFLFSADDGQPARGLVLISSSSHDENSQESDQLGGSYFTHYLSSGLRGDADESGDQRVTLAEVYGYAYHKTITETVVTRSGVQHPTYSYDLQGSGGLILTDLTRGRSAVYFSSPLEGDYLIFDSVRDHVAAEIRKIAGQPRRIALAPGQYVIKKRLSDHLRIERFELGDSQEHRVDEARMLPIAFEDDEVKGGRDDGVAIGFGARMAYQSFLSSVARSELFPPLFLFGGAAELDRLAGASLALEVLIGSRGAIDLTLGNLALPYDFLEAQIAIEMLWSIEAPDFLGGPQLSAIVGPRLAGIYLRRSFPDDEVLAGRAQDHFTLTAMGVAGARYEFDRAGRVYLETVARLGLLHFGVDDNQTLFFLEGGLSFGVSFR